MNPIAVTLMVIGMAATLGILIVGIVSMTKGGAFNDKWGNRLMRYRVVAQLFALAMFGIGLAMMKNGG